MKNLLLLILFVCILTNIKAQEYKPFPTKNAQWVFTTEIRDNWDDSMISSYCIKGDTLIENKVYQKINYLKFYQKHVFQDIYDTIDLTNVDSKFFIREEEKKIYFRFNSYSNEFNDFPNEYIAFDFNLTVNDTFINYRNDTLIVLEEIERNEGKGLALKFLTKFSGYLGDGLYIEWIEGIGNTIGSEFILGYQYNGTRLNKLTREYCEACVCFDEIITSEIPIQNPIKLNISPNPTTSTFKLNLEKQNNLIILQNLQGQIVFQEQTSDKNPILNIAHLSAGIYVLNVSNDKGKIFTGKVIKN
jgi:hypothetical protein